MRQRIVIELDGEEPVIEKMTEALRATLTTEAMGYDAIYLRGFSIFSKILSEGILEEIQMPDFLKRDKMDQQVYDRNSVSQGEEALQDG